ncbi:unnamed protein product [Miscanthus lutarioriparius]|uniref:Uncharacterized protein n=1 Tax=Miscanthus lutarioriparius TaxID=422564 RepID=A0A811S136_9POAL|nr:unnamed protein product [Miscanthus lutarioriparius]
MGSSRRPPPVAESVGERKKNGIDDLEGTNHCSYLNPVFVPSGNHNISIQWRLIPHRPPVTATVPSNSLSQRRAAWLAVEAATLAHCLRRVLLQLQRWQLLQQYTGNFFSGVLPQPGRLPGLRPGVQALRQGPGAGDPTARAWVLVSPEEWAEERRVVVHAHADGEQHALHDGLDVHDVLLVEVQQAEEIERMQLAVLLFLTHVCNDEQQFVFIDRHHIS